MRTLILPVFLLTLIFCIESLNLVIGPPNPQGNSLFKANLTMPISLMKK